MLHCSCFHWRSARTVVCRSWLDMSSMNITDQEAICALQISALKKVEWHIATSIEAASFIVLCAKELPSEIVSEASHAVKELKQARNIVRSLLPSEEPRTLAASSGDIIT